MNDLSLHFLSKKNIMVIKDIDRDQIDFISKTTGAIPVAHIDHFAEDKLGRAELVQEVSTSEKKIVKVTGCPN